MTVQSKTFTECVGKMISHEMNTHPDMPQDQAIAVAYSKCRERYNIKGDAMLLPNQPIAHEGVLMYVEGPMYKDGKDLARNVGRIVPILDEHPDANNDADGLFSGKERVWGIAKIIGYIPEKGALIADLVLDDGAPLKSGYSIGFGFNDGGAGNYNGEKYVMRQKDLTVDHIALTNDMRQDFARLVSGDAIAANTMHAIDSRSNDVVINYLAHDARVLALTGRAGEIAEKFRRLSPGAPENDIVMRAAKAYMNEQYLNTVEKNMANNEMKEEEMDQEEEEEEEETSTDSLPNLSKSDLLARLAKLEGRQRGLADSKKIIAEKDRILNQALDALERAEKHNKALVKKIDSDNLAYLETRGFKREEFKGKDSLFIEGAKYATERINLAIQGVPATTGNDANANGGAQSMQDANGGGTIFFRGQDSPGLVNFKGNSMHVDVHRFRRDAMGNVRDRRRGV